MLNTKSIDSDIMDNALYKNSYSPAVPWVKSIGFRSQGLCYREKHQLSSLAEDFLINSTNTRNNHESTHSILHYLDDAGVFMVSKNGNEDINHFPKIKLPTGPDLNLALGEALTTRRSARNYTGDIISLHYLATVLRAGYGISCEAEVQLNNGDITTMYWRTVASAGSLYPFDLLVLPLKIKGLTPKIYRYYPKNDFLLEIGDESLLQKTLNAFSTDENQISLSQANMLILFCVNPWKTMRKYGDRGLRFVFHEGGAIAQNINLATAALGLGSVECASFYDMEIQKILKMDGNFEIVTHSIIIGTV